MLNTFRKNTKVIVWSVVVAFALWGAYSVSSQFQNETMYAGSVFGKKVSFQEFNRFHRASQIFGGENSSTDPAELRKVTWQGIIFSREARNRKIEVSDDEVRKDILALLERYKIAPENYEPWLERGLRSTPKEFESQIREVLRIQKLMKVLEQSITDTAITETEAREAFLREQNQISVELIAFTDQKEAAAFRSSIKKPEDWEKASEPKRNDIRQTGSVPVEALTAIFQISSEEAQKLHAMEKGMVSEPLASGPNFIVFHILDKKTADAKVFEADKDAYIKALSERKIQIGLQEKAQGIITQANLQDFQPITPEAASSAA